MVTTEILYDRGRTIAWMQIIIGGVEVCPPQKCLNLGSVRLLLEYVPT